MVRTKFIEILRGGEEGRQLSRREIQILLGARKGEECRLLFQAADRIREEFVGKSVHLRAIIEFSNFCRQNCLYCGLRRDNRRLPRYRMALREIVRTAENAAAEGYKTIVLQSGEDVWFTRNRTADLIRRIKDQTGAAITLSVGERYPEDYRAWKQAGADRFLLKFETSSPALYRYLRAGLELKDRLNSLQALLDLGFEVGSGNMVGLPGQSIRDLARDMGLILKYDFDMLGIGPFIPHPDTPLAGARGGGVEQTLKFLAAARILTKNANLPATTALGVLREHGRERALLAGANVVMPDVTPEEYRRKYEIYPGKTRPPVDRKAVGRMVRGLGRGIGRGRGFRPPARLPSFRTS